MLAFSPKHPKGPFTQAIFVAATNCTENRIWFARAILKLQLKRDKNCIELPRQKSPVKFLSRNFCRAIFVALKLHQVSNMFESPARPIWAFSETKLRKFTPLLARRRASIPARFISISPLPHSPGHISCTELSQFLGENILYDDGTEKNRP